MSLAERFESMDQDPKIAVVGDLMLDEHVDCEVLGISPEDDLAYKLRVASSRFSPGGAANVAMNLNALGARVHLFGAIGRDAEGDTLTSMLKGAGIETSLICPNHGYPTTKKSRFLTKRGRHIVRVDREQISWLGVGDSVGIATYLADAKFSLVVVSDYNKGVVTNEMLDVLNERSVPYIVDPKSRSFGIYKKALVLTPNEKEFAAQFTKDAIKDHKFISFTYPGQAILVTQAERGAQLLIKGESDTAGFMQFPCRVRELGDPCGCGDSFIAGLAYAMASGWALFDACGLAVAAGACAVDHIGNRVVTRTDLAQELQTFNYGSVS